MDMDAIDRWIDRPMGFKPIYSISIYLSISWKMYMRGCKRRCG